MNQLVALINVGCGALYLALAIPFVKRRIGPNRIYGVRTKATFASDDAWYEINERWAKRVIGWAIAMVAIGIVAYFLPPFGNGMTAALAMAPVLVLVPCLQSFLETR